MTEIVTVPPNVWTDVAGVQLRHPFSSAKVVEVYAGKVQLDGEWEVRAVPATPRVRIENDPASPFVQPSAAARSSVRSDRTLGPVFTARFDSECGSCGGELYEGDEARMYEGSAMHRQCAESDADYG